MKANELRIGNWLMGSMPVQVTRIFDENDIGIGEGDPYAVHAEPPYKPCLRPIPLTEEWLIKFGFEKNAIYWNYSISLINQLSLNARTNCFTPCIEQKSVGDSVLNTTDSVILDDIQYVHQLQNLYFALTGKELML